MTGYPWRSKTDYSTRYSRAASALGTALFAWAAVSFAVALWDVTVGGFRFELGGLRISSWDAYKPFRNGVACAAVACWLHDRTAGDAVTWQLLARWANRLAAVVAVAFVAVSVHFGTFSAGDSDAYGYVSQAHMWASGRMSVESPLLRLAPQLGRSITPSGYRLTPKEDAIVPTYAPGYPLVMAVAVRLAGRSAAFLIAPLLGGLAVWLTFVIGRRTTDGRAALLAAALLACSPIFLFQSLQPMSDVPVTAWWLAAWTAAMVPGALPALVSGAAAALAVLTRPNLVPLAAVVALAAATQPPRILRMALLVTPVAVASLALAALNTRYYGSPLESGYGALSGLFAWQYVDDNLWQFSRWLIDLHTPIVGAALAAPFVARVKSVWWMVAFCAVTLLCYVFYFPFDNWPFLRFLLPLLPFALILVAATIVRLVGLLPLAFRGAAMLVAFTLLPCWCIVNAQHLGVFLSRMAERRYVVVGEYVGRVLPANAAVITQLHSGSLRFYGNRDTFRWDWIPPGRLDAALDVLRANGYEPYVLVERSEEAEFRSRNAATSVFGNIDWPPAIEYLGVPPVRVYALADRERYLSGRRILTRPIVQDPDD